MIYLVDAFADRPFTGNPAAVVPLDSWPEDGWMQNVAMEMNQAETAFFVPEGVGYRLRWFTPAIEVDLCGHATLAAAHILYSEIGQTGDITFQTRSGPLICRQEGKRIAMDFPSEAPYQASLPQDLPGLKPVWMGRNRMDWLIQVATVEELTAFQPPFADIAKFGLRGLIVTAQGGEGVDFTSRGFFPQAGIDEDPVTGSAHCALAPFWAERLGKWKMVGYQASKRGGTVACTVEGDRVFLAGSAITILKGNFYAKGG